MDTQVILYSVQCYALHWTDNDAYLAYSTYVFAYGCRVPCWLFDQIS